GSFEVMRTQFPLRLAYCMTYNKSQGQELQAVLVDLRNPPFTHGHLYVALSRVRHRDGIAGYVPDEDHMMWTIRILRSPSISSIRSYSSAWTDVVQLNVAG